MCASERVSRVAKAIGSSAVPVRSRSSSNRTIRSMSLE
jgi:hypothetical protein